MDAIAGVGRLAAAELRRAADADVGRGAQPELPGRGGRAAAQEPPGQPGSAARESRTRWPAPRWRRRSTAPSHPYGFPELGTEASNTAMTRDDMRAFWSQNFVPNNAALIVSGQVTAADLRPMVEKAFGDWKQGTPAQPALGNAGDDRRRSSCSSTSRARRRRSCASPASACRARRRTTRRSAS